MRTWFREAKDKMDKLDIAPKPGHFRHTLEDCVQQIGKQSEVVDSQKHVKYAPLQSLDGIFQKQQRTICLPVAK